MKTSNKTTSGKMRSSARGKFTSKASTRTVKYHPGKTSIPRERIREAVREVVAKNK